MQGSFNRDYPSIASFIGISGGAIVAISAASILILGGVPSAVLLVSVSAATVSLLCALGIVFGSIIVIAGILLRRSPHRSKTLGIVILVLAFVSLPCSLGGFGLGFILSALGGAEALIWKPGTTDPRSSAESEHPQLPNTGPPGRMRGSE